jgi:hypothetical protein
VYVLTELQDEHACIVLPSEYTYFYNLQYFSLLLQNNIGNIWLTDFITPQLLTVQRLAKGARQQKNKREIIYTFNLI